MINILCRKKITESNGDLVVTTLIIADIYDEIFHSLRFESAELFAEHFPCLRMIACHISDEDIVKVVA